MVPISEITNMAIRYSFLQAAHRRCCFLINQGIQEGKADDVTELSAARVQIERDMREHEEGLLVTYLEHMRREGERVQGGAVFL